MTVYKCTNCDQPMTPSSKNKPKHISDKNQWVLCRQCNTGIEVIGADTPSATAQVDSNAKPVSVETMRYKETKVIYVEISKIPETGGIIKKLYADEEYTQPIGEEKI